MFIYGIHPVLEALASQTRRITRLYVTRGRQSTRLQKIIDTARDRAVPIHFEPVASLTRKAGTGRHQDVVAELAEVAYTPLDDLLDGTPSLLLLLDGVEDPHNLGAVLRTAEAAGVDGILLPERRSCGVTPAVVKSSAGAALHLRISRVGNVAATIERIKDRGFWVIGLDMGGPNDPDDIDVRQPLLVVVGSENRGLRQLVRQHCDLRVALPLRGRIQSLNLSVAAAVLIYQIILRRGESRES